MWQRYNQASKIFEKSVDNGTNWTPLELDAAILTQGTIPDARLSSNVALHNASGHSWAGSHNLVSNSPHIFFTDADQPADQKVFDIAINGGVFAIYPETDTFGIQNNGLQLNRSGELYVASNIYQHGRTVPMGNWQDVPFNAANFYGAGSMTWTVGAGAVVRNRFTVVGRTVWWSMYLSWFSGSNVIGGTVSNSIRIILPFGNSNGAQMQLIDYVGVAGLGPLASLVGEIGSNYINIGKVDGSNFTAGSAPGFVFTICYEST